MLQIQSIPICYMVSKGELVDTMSGLRDEQSVADLIQKGLDFTKN